MERLASPQVPPVARFGGFRCNGYCWELLCKWDITEFEENLFNHELLLIECS